VPTMATVLSMATVATAVTTGWQLAGYWLAGKSRPKTEKRDGNCKIAIAGMTTVPTMATAVTAGWQKQTKNGKTGRKLQNSRDGDRDEGPGR